MFNNKIVYIENNDISITISDGTNDTVQNFTINVNRAPVLENELTFTFDEDENRNIHKILSETVEYDINECPICMENIPNCTLPCNHQFCKNCIDELKNKTCPMCRDTFEIKNVVCN